MSSASAGFGLRSARSRRIEPDQQRHDRERPASREQVLQQHDFQFDRVLGDVGERVVEQAVAVVLRDAVDVLLVGLDEAERRLEVLPREREPVRRVVRRGDDHEHAGIGVLDQFLESRARR